MANVKFSRKEFEKHIKITKEIEEKISLFGTPLEALTKDEIELEIFPNRPDLLSLQGYLRSFLPFIGKGKIKKYKVNKPEKNYTVYIDKSVSKIRPFTACAIVKNLKFNDEKIKEIIDIQEKIHNTFGRNRKKIAIGIYPLEKISLPITFEARAPKEIRFIPLESEKEMSGLEILQRHPTGREYSHLLENYDKFPVFVDSQNQILSMPPIINSKQTGKITEETKEVFIECSGFDFQSLNKVLNILVTLLADMSGTIYQMNLKYKKYITTPDLTPQKNNLNITNVNKLLGLNLTEKQIINLLYKMGHTYKRGIVESPAYRTDILHEVDLIEDIAIAYGYEKFIPEIPEINTIGEENKKEVKLRKLREILIGLGLQEILTFHLNTKEDLKKSKITEKIEVENSKTDFKYLRYNLISTGLRTLSENLDSEYPQKIFEIGTCFSLDESEETGIKETKKLSILLTPGNFTQIKQILDYLGRMLELKLDIEETESELFISGRTAEIKVENKKIGIIGEIKPSTLKNYHLKLPLSVLEIDLDFLN